MNIALLQFRKNLIPAQLLAALMAEDSLTVITEPDTKQVFDPRVEVHLVADSRNVELVKATLIGIMRQRHIDQLVTPFERNQITGGYLRSLLGLPGRDFETSNNCANKYAMKLRYRDAGIPTTDFGIAYGLDEIVVVAEHIGWPVVVKPVIGGGGNHVVSFPNAEAFHQFAGSKKAEAMTALDLPFIVERFVDMSGEYHCDAVVWDGSVEFVVASRYLSPLLGCDKNLNGSYFLPRDSADAKAIVKLHARAVEAIGLASGVTHMELFKTADGFLAGEIAGRVAGGGIAEAIDMRHGVDLWLASLAIAYGRRPRIAPRESDEILVNYLLPVSPGTVRRISTKEELLALPGVIRVDITKKVFDTIPNELDTSSSSGIVYVSVPSEQLVNTTIRRIASSFYLEVDVPALA
jgi:hypothetical protein